MRAQRNYVMLPKEPSAIVRRIASAARGQEAAAAATCKKYMESYRRVGEEHRNPLPLGQLNFYGMLALCIRYIDETGTFPPVPVPYTGRDDCRRHVQHLVFDFVRNEILPELRDSGVARKPLLTALYAWAKSEVRTAHEERKRQRDAPWFKEKEE